MDDERVETNRRHWDDLAAIHPDTGFYDVEAVLAGESSLREVERRELGDVSGRRLLHLQCHVGLDSISLAREGADVTAVDFSPRAVETARNLAGEAGVDVAFVECDVHDVPTVLDREFDVVFASYGVLAWIPDASRWVEVAARMLAPGGTLYLVDYHPCTAILGWERLRPEHAYFGDEPMVFDEGGSYADPDADVEHTRTYQWIHPLGEVVTAVAAAGLDLEFLHEFPHAHFRRFETMHEDDAGRWWLDDEPQVPQLFSIRATG